MPTVTSLLWWIVLGVLLGWMASWMFNRTLRTRVAVRPGPAAERIEQAPAERVVTVERVVPDSAALEARDLALRRLRDRIAHLDATVAVLLDRLADRPAHDAPTAAAAAAAASASAPRGDGLDLAAATAAGFAPRHVDDLEIVEGIGPRIAALLRAEGIATWRGLAACGPERLRDVLDLGGPGFRIADPGSWPEQAGLAADGRWAELRALQDRLVAGRR